MRWYLSYQTLLHAEDNGRLPFYAETNYPITELGDEPFKPAPTRRAQVIEFDHNKYAKVIVEGVEKEIKWGYIFITVEDSK